MYSNNCSRQPRAWGSICCKESSIVGMRFSRWDGMQALRITGNNHHPSSGGTLYCLPFPRCLKASLALDKRYAAKNDTK